MVIKRDENYKIQLICVSFLLLAILCLYVFGMQASFWIVLVLHFPVLVLVLAHAIAYGRTFIMDEQGCTVCFWKYRQTYKWAELKTKRIEDVILPSFCPYIKEAMFAPYKIHKPRMIRAQFYSWLHPFSFIYVNFVDQKGNFRNRHYEVDEVMFREKMKQWNVELEEKL